MGLLKAVSDKHNNPRLATLAYKVRLDAFTCVKKAIDDMIAQLLKEKGDEIKHNDFCIDKFNTNQFQTEKKDREKQDLLAKIQNLEATIEALAEAIKTLKAEIAEMQVQLKCAGEDIFEDGDKEKIESVVQFILDWLRKNQLLYSY